MIGAMYLNVTVQALFAEHALIIAFRQYTCSAVNTTGVKAGKVALLAQIGLSADEQILVVRAMRRMAISAVFLYRRVFPQVWTANFCMAVVTGVVQSLPHQQQVRRFAVRVVTAAAVHLALANRMGVRLHRLCA